MPKANPRTRGKTREELLAQRKGDSGNKATESTVSKKGKKKKKESPELISIMAVQHNLNELHKIRVFSGIATGTTAGILDMKGLMGFALFAAVFLITSVLMCVKMKMSVTQYLRPWNKFVSTSLWDCCTSFVLFWTFFSNVLYLYG